MTCQDLDQWNFDKFCLHFYNDLSWQKTAFIPPNVTKIWEQTLFHRASCALRQDCAKIWHVSWVKFCALSANTDNLKLEVNLGHKRVLCYTYVCHVTRRQKRLIKSLGDNLQTSVFFVASWERLITLQSTASLRSGMKIFALTEKYSRQTCWQPTFMYIVQAIRTTVAPQILTVTVQ